ncbi:Gfo/Idh/MocA family protein [Paenibacillus xerothermodurans]|uniref:Gfo/Idh/MocA family oxidoreductase n=1 Tax=Paenibacillus xerothermodurans TaxID=1977292 RepID=A0A2W1P1R5_PAEXE|nr:Gfo/Idh/MocA family oxidoreductase [Paenibacillus xerothermodurans]PZE21068.1 gfo/Idh/MocA family oxidoreductase [Paenibacillus xerothermodurans]
MNTIKVGIVGTGFSATAHMEALRRIPCVEPLGVAGSSLEKSKEIADKMNIPRAYASYQEMLADADIQAVHNCTPNSMHFEINRQVLLAGKHLLSEKPLAINSTQSAELVELAAQTDVVSGVSFNYRHYPMVSQIKEMLQAEAQSKINLVYGGYLQDWLLYDTDYSWRLDPEQNGPSRAVADIGSHWCDTVQHVLNKKITEVFADLKIVHPVRKRPKAKTSTFTASGQTEREEVQVSTEDYGSVLVHFEDGVQGVFTVSQVTAGRKNRLHFEIATSRSSFAWDQEKPDQLWVGKREQASQAWFRDPDLLSSKSAELAHYPGGHNEGWPDGLKNLCIDFYKKVLDRQHQSSFATLADGHRNMRIVEAVLQSYQEKKWIRVDT